MRAPVLVPGPQAGLGLPDARRLRIRVTSDGGLAVDGPRGSLLKVAPGEATRAVVVDGATLDRSVRSRTTGATDALALFTGERPLVLVHLHEFVARTTSDGRELRRTSGARAVADALGLLLEPAGREDVDALRGRPGRQALVSPPTTSVGRPALEWAGALVAGLLGLLSWAGRGSEVTVLLVVVALLVLAPGAIGYALRRRRFLQLVVPCPPDGRTVVRTRLDPTRHGGLADAQLQIGPDDVVLADRGTESWVPGPAYGGATRCLVGHDVVRLTDDEDHDLIVLDRQVWCPTVEDERPIVEACTAAGIACETTPMSVQRREPVPILESADLHPDRLMRPWQHGGITALLPTVTSVAGAVVVVGAALGAMHTPWSRPILLLALLIAAAPPASSWAVRRWSSRQRPRRRNA